GNANHTPASVDRTITVSVGPAEISSGESPAAGGDVQLTVVDARPNVTYQWQRNGADLPNGTGSTLTLEDAAPPTAGLYTYTATVPGGGSGGVSKPVIVGITTTQKVVGTGEEVAPNVNHPNRNV